MSRFYEMSVQISEYAQERGKALKVAAETQWSFEDWSEDEGEVEACGQGFLSGGESEEQFADRLVWSVWRANGGYCPVTVVATYLENLPFEEYSFDKDDYARMMGEHRGEHADQ